MRISSCCAISLWVRAYFSSCPLHSLNSRNALAAQVPVVCNEMKGVFLYGQKRVRCNCEWCSGAEFEMPRWETHAGAPGDFTSALVGPFFTTQIQTNHACSERKLLGSVPTSFKEFESNSKSDLAHLAPSLGLNLACGSQA
eukprot:8748408-Pyramimonas_sp.AAC.1